MSHVLHIEVCQRIDSLLSVEEINKEVQDELRMLNTLDLCSPIIGKHCSNNVLRDHVESISFYRSINESTNVSLNDGIELALHVYRLQEEEPAMETICDGDNNSDELPVATHWVLPSLDFKGLWESLYYDSDIKENLLSFVETTILFSDRQIDANIISWNRVVLLHGPPGTGKTSLCKALAQKLAIRFNDRYSHFALVEINSHSLFSKWFSESGKLVMKMFGELKQLLENPDALVCVLIDEVESLAHARKSSVSGTEPSDSIRVVNALLTQLDHIKRYQNVLILTTSNVTEAIDLAFVDRADIKQYIGHPSEIAIYKIYQSCIKELTKAQIIENEDILDISHLKANGYEENSTTRHSLRLLELSRESVGLSGRALRKIPFLAHSLYLRTKTANLSQFLRAMHLAVTKHKEDAMEQTY
ncbi:pachytene checkpoint protein 2 homolog isoform X1 [Neodiprion pinetum]|uniref:Pachytene checkpoint protein 2 homolog n=1 Tax=Neodiprion lecontei TaxID=441921 RepID=A0A6J0BST5_NEOLC|nr:pachytene checkpoint protein 2 homolog isoform X1 [Neodiprion lecontei]XP_046436377.1 pachytene checkpoint protein 2 homolog isoform X1 [Neodiprion fabricii]XP_046493364.1 pachytene checkpoint protein 2 homolog isoform X1 [Neodiprion pinetum]